MACAAAGCNRKCPNTGCIPGRYCTGPPGRLWNAPMNSSLLLPIKMAVACFALAMDGSICDPGWMVTAHREGMPRWPKFPSSTPTFTCTT